MNRKIVISAGNMNAIRSGKQPNIGGGGGHGHGANPETPLMEAALGEIGIDLKAIPAGVRFSVVDLYNTAGNVLVSDQFPPVDMQQSLSPDAKRHMKRKVQPAIANVAAKGDPRAFKLAHALGRMAGHYVSHGAQLQPPVRISADTIDVDGRHVPHTFENGFVVDYGMGLNGLATHIANMRAGLYSAFGIHRNPYEAAMLTGFAEQAGVDKGKARMNADGIPKAARQLSEHLAGKVDLVIASRVQAAGRDLTEGLKANADILRPGGLVIARGPAREGNLGYDKVAGQLKQDSELEVLVDRRFVQSTGRYQNQAGRLIVARRK